MRFLVLALLVFFSNIGVLAAEDTDTSLALSEQSAEESLSSDASDDNDISDDENGEEPEPLPHPLGWSVESNPSVQNSLSYVHESGRIAVNISYIAGKAGGNVMPEAYARVAAEQMNCDMPTASNIIDHAWSFYCPREEIEAIVYGDEGNLVLLAISGRNEETESYLSDFIRFLIYQAGRQ